jgi:hypothetical protein
LFKSEEKKTWMPGTRPGMTLILKSAQSANAAWRRWQDTIAAARRGQLPRQLPECLFSPENPVKSPIQPPVPRGSSSSFVGTGAAGHARHAGGRQGPTAVGAITDVFGNLSCELNASALLLALGAVAAAFQRRLARST